MRRIASFIPLAIFCAGLALSCTSKDQFMQERVLDSVFSINELAFDPMGESFSFTYSAESNWQISAPSWLVVNPSSGRAGTYEVTVSAAINDSWAQRSGDIEVSSHRIQVSQPCPYLRISYAETPAETISVSDVPVTGPGVSEGTVFATYAWNHSEQARRSPLRLRVESNVPWEIVFEQGSDQTYFEVDSHNTGTYNYNSGAESSQIDIDLQTSLNNYGNDDMETGFLIRPTLVEGTTRENLDKAIASFQFALHQNHLRFLINGMPDAATSTFDELGYPLDDAGSIIPGGFQASLQVDCEIPWEVLFLDAEGNPLPSAGSFVSSNILQGQVDPLMLEIPNRFNPTEEQREMIVRLSAEHGEAFRDIHVVQRPYIFEIDGDGMADTEFDNGELETGSGAHIHHISLLTSGAWTVSVPSTDPDWLRMDPATAGGEAAPGQPYTSDIRFWALSQNLHLKNPAQAFLRFTAANGLVKDIPITQAPFRLQADYDPAELNNISATRLAERKDLRVNASNSWTFKQSDGSALVDTDWYALTDSHGDGPASDFWVGVGAAVQNPSETVDRSMTMLLTSDIHESMSASEKVKWAYEPVRVAIRQRHFSFLVNNKGTGESISVSIPAYKVDFTDYLDIDCDASWTFENIPSWIHPTMAESDTDQDVLLRPDINLEKSTRTGRIDVKCVWGQNVRVISVDLIQEALVFEVSRTDSKSLTNLDPDINFEDHKPTTYGFRVVATDELPWRLTSDNSAFIRPVSSLVGSQTVSLSPAYNTDLYNSRSANVHITLDAGADGRISSSYVNRYSSENTWTFTQKKYEFDSGDVGTTAAFRALGALRSGARSYSFSCSGPWEVSNCPSWMHLRSGNQDISGGASNPSFELVPDNNLALSARGTSWVTIRSKIGGYTKSIPVSQDAYQYGVTSSKTLRFATVSPAEATLTFRSSGNWELEGASGWGFSQTSGTGNDNDQVISVKVKPSDYLKTDADHTATVTLKSSYGGTSFATEVISLEQPKYVFGVNTSGVSFASPFLSECAAQAVNVSCSGDWTATTSNDWVRISNGSGTGNGIFSIGVAKDNLTLSGLNATVTVTTTYKGTKVSEVTIPVSQAQYSFSLSKETYQFSNNGGTTTIDIVCSGDWVVTKTKDDDAMISSFSPTSGKKNATISFTANTNTGRTAKDKTATFQVKCENSDQLVKTITFTQKK